MHYVISDVHNDNKRLREMLRLISFSEDDRLYILGDLFDRCEYAPDPVGVYFTILRLGEQCTVLCGNHDEGLARYILDYFKTPERKRKNLAPYSYNSFELLRKHLTPIDMQDMAHWILSKPNQTAVAIDGINYQFAHHVASLLSDGMEEREFLNMGAEARISIFGHTSTQNRRIWKSTHENVWCVDCGCGYRSGQLGCLCLETQQEFYVP